MTAQLQAPTIGATVAFELAADRHELEPAERFAAAELAAKAARDAGHELITTGDVSYAVGRVLDARRVPLNAVTYMTPDGTVRHLTADELRPARVEHYRRTAPTDDSLRFAGLAAIDPEYADVDEDGQLAVGVPGDQRAIPGLAAPRPAA